MFANQEILNVSMSPWWLLYRGTCPPNFPSSTLMHISIVVTYCNISLFKNFEGAFENSA
jgi:hypothetical protein